MDSHEFFSNKDEIHLMFQQILFLVVHILVCVFSKRFDMNESSDILYRRLWSQVHPKIHVIFKRVL